MMELERSYVNSLFGKLEYIARRYGETKPTEYLLKIGDCVTMRHIYWYDETKPIEETDVYFILFHESFREIVMNANIPEMYEKQKVGDWVGWKIFKVDREKPVSCVYKILRFVEYAELVYALFDRYDIEVPEIVSNGFRAYIYNIYRDAQDSKRDPRHCHFNENEMNNHIMHFYDGKWHKNFKEIEKNMGKKEKSYEERLIDVPTPNKNCISEKELKQKYSDVKELYFNYEDAITLDNCLTSCPKLFYAKSKAYISYDNRVDTINGERIDKSGGKDIYGKVTIYFSEEMEPELAEAFVLGKYPYLKNHLLRTESKLPCDYEKIDIPEWNIDALCKVLKMYGIDFWIVEINFLTVSIIVQTEDAPSLNLVIKSAWKSWMNNHVYRPMEEMQNHSDIGFEIEQCLERKANGRKHPYPTGREEVVTYNGNLLGSKLALYKSQAIDVTKQKAIGTKKKKGFFGFFKK